MRSYFRIAILFFALGPLIGLAMFMAYTGFDEKLVNPVMLLLSLPYAYIYGGVSALFAGLLYRYIMQNLPRYAMNWRIFIGAFSGAVASSIFTSLLMGAEMTMSISLGAGAGAICALTFSSEKLLAR